jgi:hypothetical protein
VLFPDIWTLPRFQRTYSLSRESDTSQNRMAISVTYVVGLQKTTLTPREIWIKRSAKSAIVIIPLTFRTWVTTGGTKCTSQSQLRREHVLKAYSFIYNLFNDAGSNICPQSGSSDWDFSWFYSVPPGECRNSILQLGHDSFLPNPFQFITHLSSYQSTLYILSYWKVS